MRPTHERLFGPVIFWTVLTGIFAWLPLVRILGRPEGYTWGILGLHGEGTDGPFWIFVLLTAYVLAMLYTGFRGPRAVFHPLLVVWHLTVTGVVLAGVVEGGAGATWQGQGLRWEVPLWLLVVPFATFTALAVAWVVMDRRAGGEPVAAGWGRGNTVRLVASLALLVVALLLFRAGTNYDGVTGGAILITILHWVLLVQALAVPGVEPGAVRAAPLGTRR